MTRRTVIMGKSPHKKVRIFRVGRNAAVEAPEKKPRESKRSQVPDRSSGIRVLQVPQDAVCSFFCYGMILTYEVRV
jgi:hypothetical protein